MRHLTFLPHTLDPERQVEPVLPPSKTTTMANGMTAVNISEELLKADKSAFEARVRASEALEVKGPPPRYEAKFKIEETIRADAVIGNEGEKRPLRLLSLGEFSLYGKIEER